MKITQQLLKEMIEEELGQILSESEVGDEVMDVVNSINNHLLDKFHNTKNGGTMAFVSRPRVDPIQIKRTKDMSRRGLKQQTVLVPVVITYPS